MHVWKCASCSSLKIRDAKITQKIAICTPSPNFVGLYLCSYFIYWQLVKTCYISSTCPHNMVNVGPLMAEIGLPVWGTVTNFNGFIVSASLLHWRLWTEVNQTLHDVWPSPWLVHYIYLFRAVAPNRILPGAKFALCLSLAFSYICSITVRTWVVGDSQTLQCSAEGAAYIWQGGHRIGHWPTF